MKGKRGNLIFLSGGTSAKPKVFLYTEERLEASIEAKRKLFEIYGVNSKSNVAVGHPFGPWSIGQIHAEAALRLGATVFQIGLNIGKKSYRSILEEFSPDVICAGLRIIASMDPPHKAGERLIFVAGERVNPKHVNKVERTWNAKVVDVYGMAEFDMVAATLPFSTGMVMVPHLEAKVRLSDGSLSNSPGAFGQLFLRRKSCCEWVETMDRVTIIGNCDDWGTETAELEFYDRIDGAVSFSDGSMLCEEHVLVARANLQLETLQVKVFRGRGQEWIEILVHSPKVMCRDHIISTFLDCALDVADAFLAGVISSINVSFVDLEQLATTDRGKTPLILCQESL